jgi:hypothetical protein
MPDGLMLRESNGEINSRADIESFCACALQDVKESHTDEEMVGTRRLELLTSTVSR